MSETPVFVYPEWGRKWPLWSGGAVRPSVLGIPQDLADRLRSWNYTWQTVLNPQNVNRWQNPEDGRRWIREGRQLISDLQDFFGDSREVIGDFEMYDPDRAEPVSPEN